MGSPMDLALRFQKPAACGTAGGFSLPRLPIILSEPPGAGLVRLHSHVDGGSWKRHLTSPPVEPGGAVSELLHSEEVGVGGGGS